jgi:hypothetical protein
MSEPHEEPKNPDSRRAILNGAGFACLGVFFSGLGDVLWANESASDIKLVFGVLEMIFGGIGAAYVRRAKRSERSPGSATFFP